MVIIFKKGVKVADCEVCDSIRKKARGLMFSGKKDLLFVFRSEKKISLHMLFVFFPIDVILLNKKKKIIEIKRIKPFSFYTTEKKGLYVIELCRKGNLKIGDQLDFTL